MHVVFLIFKYLGYFSLLWFLGSIVSLGYAIPHRRNDYLKHHCSDPPMIEDAQDLKAWMAIAILGWVGLYVLIDELKKHNGWNWRNWSLSIKPSKEQLMQQLLEE